MKSFYFKYIAGLLLFGSNGLFITQIHLSSSGIAFYRALLGALFLGIIYLFSGNKKKMFRYKKETLFIIISGVAMGADWLLLFEAYKQIGVSLGILLNYCGPALVIAFSPLVLKEALTKEKIIALAAALLGMCLINVQAASTGMSILGLSCGVLSALTFAVMVFANKKAIHIQGLGNATLQTITTAVVITVFVGLKEGIPTDVVTGDWLPILWLGLINTGLGCYLYFSGVNELPAQTVALCGYLEPLSAVLFSVAFLGEIMLPLQILGAVLILGGAIYGECSKTKVKQPVPHRQ